MMPKWNQNGAPNPSKMIQRVQRGAKGAPKRRKRQKKDMPQTNAKKEAKLEVGRPQCAWDANKLEKDT